MRKVIVIVAIALFFLAGVGVLCYPMIADYFNSRNQSRAVSGYYNEVAQINEVDYSDIVNAANEYNLSLLTNGSRFLPTETDIAAYNKLLSYRGSQIMGILEIGSINVKLAIYHGTSEGVLQVGIGHIEGSSLPIGGPGTHSALSGHRGLPSSTLLTHLDKVVVGDTFTLHILKETLTYQVDQILVADPDDMSAMAIEDGQDYCTLVTCTPYGINSHRMLVRGHRVENAVVDTTAPKPIVVEADATQYGIVWIVLTVTGFALLISAIIGTISFLIFIKSHKLKEGGKNRR